VTAPSPTSDPGEQGVSFRWLGRTRVRGRKQTPEFLIPYARRGFDTKCERQVWREAPG
jgi:hypothetical protein